MQIATKYQSPPCKLLQSVTLFPPWLGGIGLLQRWLKTIHLLHANGDKLSISLGANGYNVSIFSCKWLKSVNLFRSKLPELSMHFMQIEQSVNLCRANSYKESIFHEKPPEYFHHFCAKLPKSINHCSAVSLQCYQSLLCKLPQSTDHFHAKYSNLPISL